MDTVEELLAISLKRSEELALESAALDNLITTYRQILAGREAAGAHANAQLDLWKSGSGRRLQADQIAEMLEEARRMILAERRPLKRGELVRRLLARGFKIIGTDKNKVFGTNVWRSHKFVHVPGEGYWPAEMPLPDEFDSLLHEQPRSD